MYEWQYLGNNDWVFGKKIRGVVRCNLADIYYTEEAGWIWIINVIPVTRGVANSFVEAITMIEIKLVEDYKYDIV